MNVLFKNRYFRRECMAQTWTPKRLAQHLPAGAWYFDYIDYEKGITNFNIIWKLCELGDLQNLRKVKKYTYCKMVGFTVYTNHLGDRFYDNKIIRCIRHPNKNTKTINIELIVSCYYGHLPVVQYLVEQGANIHIHLDQPLRWSAEEGHLPVVQYLVEQGANIHAWDEYAFRWSAVKGHLPVVQYLVEQGANIYEEIDIALRWSVEEGHLPVVKYLMDQRINVYRHKDMLGLSAAFGHLPIVQYLVEQEEDIHANNDEALRNSVKNGYYTIAKYLVEKGANKLILSKRQLKKLNSLT